jgi:hypothetical protein
MLNGELSEPQLAVLNEIFAGGPLRRVPAGWVGNRVVLAVAAAQALICRGLAEIKEPQPKHLELHFTAAGADLASRINGHKAVA